MNQKKSSKPKSKSAHHNKKYVQKQLINEWTCQVCASLNSNANVYCQNCLQTLYYYNYVNAHLFVEKDESYLQFYEPIEVKRKYSWATNDTEEDDDGLDDSHDDGVKKDFEQ